MNFNNQRLAPAMGLMFLTLALMVSRPASQSVAGLEQPDSAVAAQYQHLGMFHGFVLGGSEADHLDQITLGYATKDSSSKVIVDGRLGIAWQGSLLKGASGLGEDVSYEAVFLDGELVLIQVLTNVSDPNTSMVSWFNRSYQKMLPAQGVSASSLCSEDELGNQLRIEEGRYRPDGRGFLELRHPSLARSPEHIRPTSLGS